VLSTLAFLNLKKRLMSDIKDAIRLVCEEKNISSESVIDTIEAALAAAYRKDFGQKNQNIKVDFDVETNGMKVFDVKLVVADIDLDAWEKERLEVQAKRAEGEEIDEEALIKFNPKTDLMISEAKLIDKKAKLEQEIKIPLEVPAEFGRMAAQTAKQVIIQKLREAEREVVYENFKNRQGELVNGIIQRREGRVVLVDVNQAMTVLPPEEQSTSDRYLSGARMKFLIGAVERTAKGPEIRVSRANPELVKRLFENEVPEIASGAVEIKEIAREAGSRTKIAVTSNEDNIDPVGSCVGQRGNRVQTVISELNGEKIDIIEWSKNPERFIANSLSPAKVESLKLDKDNNTASIRVKSDQLSLAIGRDGQNVRLASKLTGWKINIEGFNEPVEGEAVEAVVEPEVVSEVKEETPAKVVKEKKVKKTKKTAKKE
jgi:N utilization substance protein A